MSHKSLDLYLVVGLALAAVAAALVGAELPALRFPLGLALALILPGYALTAALFPGPPLALPERSALSLGMSLAVTALGGLMLHLTPWGLRAASWALLLGAVTVAAAALAYARRRTRPQLAAHTWDARVLVRRSLLYLPALIALVAAFGVAVNGARREPTAGFTQLWMLPAATGEQIQLGVANMEAAPTGYRLELRLAGQQRQVWEQLTLGPGERWTTTVSLPAAGWAEAILYRQETPGTIYRRVLLGPKGEREGLVPTP